jgi:excisionase family DNA binding protein
MAKKPAQLNSPVYLTQKRAAELLDVHVDTVRRWCRLGKLGSARFGDGVIRIPLWAVFPPEAIQPANRPATVAKDDHADVPGQRVMEFRECG